MKWLSKTLIIIVIVSLLSPLIPITTRTVKAQVFVPTFESNPILVGGVEGDFLQSLFEWAQTFVTSTLKKRLLDMLVDQIIQWIQGGGNPQFVSDWQGFLSDAANIAIGDFAQEIGAGFLCSPFNLRIQLDLRFRRFSQQITCSLDSIVGNIEAFYDDFRNGGWIGYTATWEPENNYFGASLIAYQEQQSRIYNAQRTAELEASSGGGFLSTKNCKENPDGKGPDIDGDGKRGDISSTCVITTPGNTIGNLVSKAVGSDIDYILSAKQLGEYVSAIADAAINRLVIEGVNGLRGLTTKKAPPRGGIQPGAGKCRGLAGPLLASCRNYISSSGNSFSSAQFRLLSQIDEVLRPREQAQANINASIKEVRDYASELGTLKDEFGKLSLAECRLRDVNINEINIELKWASSTAPTLLAQKTANQDVLDKLIKNRDDIKNLVRNDWVNFSLLADRLNTSNFLKLIEAEKLESDTGKQAKRINGRIQKALNKFNDELNKCAPAGP